MDLKLPDLPKTDYEKQKQEIQAKARKAHKELMDYRSKVEKHFEEVLADVDERIRQAAEDAGISNSESKLSTAAAQNPDMDGEKVVAYIKKHGGSVPQQELMDAFDQKTAHKFGGMVRQGVLRKDVEGNYAAAEV